MATITVTAKDNLGHSPKFGGIFKGNTYTIEEADFASELFDPPPGFDVAPYQPAPSDAPVAGSVAVKISEIKNKTDVGARRAVPLPTDTKTTEEVL